MKQTKPKEEIQQTDKQVVEPAADEVVEEVNPLIAEVELWKNKYLRALADYQNLERRSYEEKDQTRKYAAEMVLRRIVPMLDLFIQAQKHLQDPGLDLAIKELTKTLAEFAVEKIETVGKSFDPGVMECVEVVPGENGVVVSEVTAGYTLYGKILRVAKVNVGAGEKTAK